MCWRRGERYAVISSSTFVAMRFKRVGRKVAFAGCKMSGGITGALYPYCTCVEVGSAREGGSGPAESSAEGLMNDGNKSRLVSGASNV